MAKIFLQQPIYINWPAIRERRSKTCFSKNPVTYFWFERSQQIYQHNFKFGNRRIASRKFRLQMLMLMQLSVQLLGVLYACEFKGLDQLLTIGFGILNLWCMNSIRAGLIGVRENDFKLLEGYYISSQCATIVACAFVYNYCRGAESTRTWMGMNPSDLCLYLYILYAVMVEIAQTFTTLKLIEDLAPA